MMNYTQLSDEAALAELGERLARHRIDRGLTQAQLAEQAGVSKSTVERIEAGASTQLANLVRVLRVLELLGNIDRLVPAHAASPMELLKHGGKQRKRAAATRDNATQAKETSKPWSWDDD